MNRNDRKELEKALDLLRKAQEILETLADAEQEKFDNMSDGLQGSDRGQAIETAATALTEGKESVDNAIESLEAIE